jgi:hypothetical protein
MSVESRPAKPGKCECCGTYGTLGQMPREYVDPATGVTVIEFGPTETPAWLCMTCLLEEMNVEHETFEADEDEPVAGDA